MFVDTNVLVKARILEAPDHEIARASLESAFAEPQPVQDGALPVLTGVGVAVVLVEALDGVFQDGLHPGPSLVPQSLRHPHHRVGGAVPVGKDPEEKARVSGQLLTFLEVGKAALRPRLATPPGVPGGWPTRFLVRRLRGRRRQSTIRPGPLFVHFALYREFNCIA